jgi:hypothetical protein
MTDRPSGTLLEGTGSIRGRQLVSPGMCIVHTTKLAGQVPKCLSAVPELTPPKVTADQQRWWQWVPQSRQIPYDTFQQSTNSLKGTILLRMRDTGQDMLVESLPGELGAWKLGTM